MIYRSAHLRLLRPAVPIVLVIGCMHPILFGLLCLLALVIGATRKRRA